MEIYKIALDIEEWGALARLDPLQFEQRRAKTVLRFIRKATTNVRTMCFYGAREFVAIGGAFEVDTNGTETLNDDKMKNRLVSPSRWVSICHETVQTGECGYGSGHSRAQGDRQWRQRRPGPLQRSGSGA